jgi:hypothetical protein
MGTAPLISLLYFLQLANSRWCGVMPAALDLWLARDREGVEKGFLDSDARWVMAEIEVELGGFLAAWGRGGERSPRMGGE